jgi:uncharacterized caspase-like protein
MKLGQLGVSRRTMLLGAAVFAGLVSAGIGANAALNKRGPELSASRSMEMATGSIGGQSRRLALVVGNSRYPDANAPLTQPINDARALATALHNDGFDVDLLEDARKDDIVGAVERIKDKVRSDSVVMLYFGGYGVQSGGESYMIPVDATIWKERDVRRDGVSIEWVLGEMAERGARAKLVVVDASRRNPYERRFRNYSRGLAPISDAHNALILSAAPPDKVLDDNDNQHSLLVAELLDSMNSPAGTAEKVFDRTRVAVSRATEGEQVPTVSSSLVEDIKLGSGPAHLSDRGS